MRNELDYDGEVVAGRRYRFEVVEEFGLGARTSAIIVRAAQKMKGAITIDNDENAHEENAHDACSILGIMTLEFYCGRMGSLKFDQTQSAAPLKETLGIIRIMEAEDGN